MARTSSQFDRLLETLSSSNRRVTDPEYKGLRWNWSSKGVYPSIVLSVDGTQKVVWKGTVGTTRTAAIKVWKEKQVGRDRGEIAVSEKTFDEAVKETIADMQRKVDRGDDSYSWRYAYQTFPSNYDKHVKPVIGHKRLDKIDGNDLRKIRTAMEDKGLAGSTINSAFTVVRTTFNFARGRGWVVHHNPFMQLVKGDLPDQSPREDWVPIVLRPDEIKKWIEQVTDEWKTLAEVVGNRGPRVAEACGLKWRDVDFVDEIIRIHEQLIRGRAFGSEETVVMRGKTKSKNSVRIIPMNDTIREALYRQLEVEQAKGLGREDDYVFTNRLKEPRNARVAYDRFVAAGKRAGLGDKIAPQVLRRSVATAWAEAGKSSRLGAEMMGHSESVFKDSYDKPVRDRERTEKLREAFDEVGL